MCIRDRFWTVPISAAGELRQHNHCDFAMLGHNMQIQRNVCGFLIPIFSFAVDEGQIIDKNDLRSQLYRLCFDLFYSPSGGLDYRKMQLGKLCEMCIRDSPKCNTLWGSSTCGFTSIGKTF